MWSRIHMAGAHAGFVTVSDVLPTLLEAVGAPDAVPNDLDGRSQWAALRGQGESQTPDYVTSGLEGLALYRPPWKLVDPDAPRLHQLVDDPLEERDLAAERPELVEELVAAARAWPRGASLDRSFLQIFLDPDSFGGPEDREPWPDAARERVP